VNEQTSQPASVELTERAAVKLKELLQREGRPTAALRVAVQSGGCSGLRYELRFDDQRCPGDQEWTRLGVPLVVDPESAPHLTGARVDFIDDLNEGGFRIENPSAASTCGCGESFSR